MTKLQLENSEVIVGIDFTNNKRVNEILGNTENNSYLLYPGIDNFNLSECESPEIKSFFGLNPYLFILDGTWPCARKMLKLSRNLQRLQRVSFDNRITSKFIIKQQPGSLCLSTIESVYTVINLLKEAGVEHCDTTDFLLPFEKMIKYQVKCILNPNNNHHARTALRKITIKNRYKEKPKVRIIFE